LGRNADHFQHLCYILSRILIFFTAGNTFS
jgi:hypothetical protein